MAEGARLPRNTLQRFDAWVAWIGRSVPAFRVEFKLNAVVTCKHLLQWGRAIPGASTQLSIWHFWAVLQCMKETGTARRVAPLRIALSDSGIAVAAAARDALAEEARFWRVVDLAQGRPWAEWLALLLVVDEPLRSQVGRLIQPSDPERKNGTPTWAAWSARASVALGSLPRDKRRAIGVRRARMTSHRNFMAILVGDRAPPESFRGDVTDATYPIAGVAEPLERALAGVKTEARAGVKTEEVDEQVEEEAAAEAAAEKAEEDEAAERAAERAEEDEEDEREEEKREEDEEDEGKEEKQEEDEENEDEEEKQDEEQEERESKRSSSSSSSSSSSKRKRPSSGKRSTRESAEERRGAARSAARAQRASDKRKAERKVERRRAEQREVQRQEEQERKLEERREAERNASERAAAEAERQAERRAERERKQQLERLEAERRESEREAAFLRSVGGQASLPGEGKRSGLEADLLVALAAEDEKAAFDELLRATSRPAPLSEVAGPPPLDLGGDLFGVGSDLGLGPDFGLGLGGGAGFSESERGAGVVAIVPENRLVSLAGGGGEGGGGGGHGVGRAPRRSAIRLAAQPIPLLPPSTAVEFGAKFEQTMERRTVLGWWRIVFPDSPEPTPPLPRQQIRPVEQYLFGRLDPEVGGSGHAEEWLIGNYVLGDQVFAHKRTSEWLVVDNLDPATVPMPFASADARVSFGFQTPEETAGRTPEEKGKRLRARWLRVPNGVYFMRPVEDDGAPRGPVVAAMDAFATTSFVDRRTRLGALEWCVLLYGTYGPPFRFEPGNPGIDLLQPKPIDFFEFLKVVQAAFRSGRGGAHRNPMRIRAVPQTGDQLFVAYLQSVDLAFPDLPVDRDRDAPVLDVSVGGLLEAPGNATDLWTMPIDTLVLRILQVSNMVIPMRAPLADILLRADILSDDGGSIRVDLPGAVKREEKEVPPRRTFRSVVSELDIGSGRPRSTPIGVRFVLRVLTSVHGQLQLVVTLVA